MKYPKIIYKYRTWDNKYDKDILRKNQLYLSSPKRFNDPNAIEIINQFGQVARRINSEQNNMSNALDIPGLPEGLYFLNVLSQDKISRSKKFVVAREF